MLEWVAMPSSLNYMICLKINTLFSGGSVGFYFLTPSSGIILTLTQKPG